MLCNQCGSNNPHEANFCIRCGADLNRTAARRSGPAALGSGPREWGPGDILGKRYKILEKCGAGGMGVVYKAHDLVLEMVVAVKALHPILIEDERAIADMQREARMAMSLAHPNIVRIYTFDDREKILVMEYVEGLALDQRMARQPDGRLSLEESTHYLKQICEGLQCAYQASVVHCDVKPANLLITEARGLKVADFGIARVAKDSMTRRFTIKTIAGTPHYMSPEQWRSVKNLDIRTDLYSAGVIFYQMLTGHVPYPGDSSFSIGLKHINDPIPDPREELRELPEWVALLIAKALAKRPEDRYQTPQAMLEAIPGAVRMKTSQPKVQPVRRDETAGRKALPPRLSVRRRAPVWLAITMAALAITLAGTLYRHYQRSAVKPPAETRPAAVTAADTEPSKPAVSPSEPVGDAPAPDSDKVSPQTTPGQSVAPSAAVSKPAAIGKNSLPRKPAAVSEPPAPYVLPQKSKAVPSKSAAHRSRGKAQHTADVPPAASKAEVVSNPVTPKKTVTKADASKEKAAAARQARQEGERRRKEEDLRRAEQRVEAERRKEESRRREAQRQAEIQVAQGIIDQAERALRLAQRQEAETYARELYDRARSSLGQALHTLAQSPAEAERLAVQAREAAQQAARQAPIAKAQIAINAATAALKTAKDNDAERYAATRLAKARKALDEATRLLNSDPAQALEAARGAKVYAEDAVKVTQVVRANQTIHEAQEARIQARAVEAERLAAVTYREGDDVLQQALAVLETDPVQAGRLAQRALVHIQDSITQAKKRREDEARRRRNLQVNNESSHPESDTRQPLNVNLKVDNAGSSAACRDKVYFEIDGYALGIYETPVTIPLQGLVGGIHSYFVRVRRYCGEQPPRDFIGSGQITLSASRSLQVAVCGKALCVQ